MLGSVLILISSQPRAQDDAELEALLNLLEQETEIATRTRMNSDFVPGIVTVLNGEKLEALGARTVWDALPYVPGVQAILDGSGSPSVTVRGLPFPFNSGSIQVLVDGIPIGRESAGLNGSALYVPIEQVERLEFIRGPGSVIYGDFAFQGLLNIITRKTADRADIRVDSRDGALGGTVQLVGGDDRRGWNISVAVRDADEALVPIGNLAREQRASAFAGLRLGGFSARFNLIERDMDVRQGNPRFTGYDESSWAAELSHDHAFGEDLDGHWHLRHLDNDIATGGNSFNGAETEIGYELFWRGWAHQNWLVGFEYQTADIDRAIFAPRRPPPGGPPPGGNPPPPMPNSPLDFSGNDRDVTSLYVQNQIEVNPALRLTLGARYDDIDVIGERVTPRASIVWQPAERHILKFQYSEGFRTPTFFELFEPDTTRNLDFEVNRTSEFTYIFRRPRLVFRATAFDTRIEDMVFPDFQGGGFGNVAEAEAHGLEFEWNQQLTPTLQFDANLSWADSEDNRNPQGLTGELRSIPDWMGNLGVLWRPAANWILAAHWNHVGERDTAASDSGEVDQVDLTATRADLWFDGLDLRIGVINALNEDIVHIVDSANADRPFRYDTRTVWAQLSWSW